VSAPSGVERPPTARRANGWPAPRGPRWLLPAGVVLVAAAVAVGLAHRPSHQQRAADMRGFLYSVTYDIDSCSGDVSRSLAALHEIDAGTSHDVPTAVKLAGTGSADCSPANNELIDDLENYVVPESLASYHLGTVVSGLIDWAAPNAVTVQSDIARVLAARGTAAEAGDRAALTRALRRMDAKRAAVLRVLRPAIAALAPGSAEPSLPG
jgi:hypothetical protein